MGGSRKEVLRRLLEIAESELGRTMLRDARRKNEGGGGGGAEWVRPSGSRVDSGNEGRGRERDVAGAGGGRVRREEIE